MDNRAPEERTLVAGVELTGVSHDQSSALYEGVSAEESLQELATLAESAGAIVVSRTLQTRRALDSATLVGSGKVAEIKQRV
ncbi:MAG: hypothetical protein JOY85_10445, partial [Acidobacteriaceae bacterium]|nr:hypothetical protein [Acidobacteriaceae bacterium]